jgi:hypothetical protein
MLAEALFKGNIKLKFVVLGGSQILRFFNYF